MSAAHIKRVDFRENTVYELFVGTNEIDRCIRVSLE